MSRTLDAPGTEETTSTEAPADRGTSSVTVSATGLAAGAFDVDLSGQATYRLDIRVPPGINGAQPRLALAYGHHHRNGALGVGWDLAGRSAISRVKATYAVDGVNGAVTFGPGDRFAIDGRRLVVVDGEYHAPGAVYETEVRDYERVVAGDGPAAGFRSTTRSGEVHTYGTTPDSRVLAGADVWAWALSATEDLDGNRVEYHYTAPPGTGSRYLSRVAYTSRADGTAANRFVDLTYEPRPDPITEAVGGRVLTTELRLARITVSVAGEVVRTYDLTYAESAATGLSVLTSVRESGAAADGSPALPATSFTWRDSALPRFDIGDPCVLGPATPGEPDVRVLTVAGTGRSDLGRFWRDGEGRLGVSTWLAGPAGGFTHGFDCVLGAFPPRHQVLLADLDGDGRTDLVVAYADGQDQRLRFAVFHGTGTGFDVWGEPFDAGVTWDATHLAFFTMDVNGDGRTDIVHAVSVHDEARGEVLALRTHLSEYGSGGTFTTGTTTVTGDPARPDGLLGFWPADVDGNGMVDLVRVWRDGDDRLAVASYVAAGTAIDDVSFGVVHSSLTGFGDAALVSLLPVDVNGDGVQDLVQVWEERGTGTVTSHLSVFLSTGAGGFVRGADSAFPETALSDGDVFAMDLNGNATTALVWRSRTTDEIVFTPFVPSPSGVYRRLPMFSGGPIGIDTGRTAFLPVDVNGDGRADLVRLTVAAGEEVTATPYVSAGAPLDVITAITTPLGERITVGYAPLSDPDVYTTSRTARFPDTSALRHPGPLTPTVGPVQRVLGSALYVVSGYERSADGARNRFPVTDRRRLTYRDALLDLTGRGWLGFAAVVALDPDTGRRTTTAYRQDFPFTGAVARVRIEALPVPGGDPRVPAGSPPLLLRTTEYTHDSRRAGPVAEVLLTATLESHYDYGADRFDHAFAHRFDHDEFGNRTVDADLGYVDPATRAPLRPGDVVYRHRGYENVVTPGGWSLGHLRHEKVTRVAEVADLTTFADGDYRLHRYDLAPGTYQVVSSAVWDDTAGAFLATTYAYDEFGNRTAETPPGGGTTRHEFDPGHHTYPMRTVHPPDDQGVSLTEWFGHDPRFGARVAHLDGNGQVTVAALDAFGRVAVRQVPVDPGGVTDANAVPACVTGTAESRQRLRSAAVVTVEHTTREAGAAEQVVEVRALQAFPAGPERSWVATRTAVDAEDRPRRTVRESGQQRGDVVELVDYDAEGRPVRRSLPSFTSDPAPAFVTTRYDVLGRAIAQETPADTGVRTTTWYHGPSGVVTETSAAGTTLATVRLLVHRRYDGTDRVRLVVADPDGTGARTVFEFDPLGRPVRAVDPPTATTAGGVATAITHDSLDRRTTYDCPDLNPVPAPGRVATRYRHDPVTGLLADETDAAGGCTGYAYDHLRRLLTTRLPDGRVVERGYDLPGTAYGLGRLCRVVVRDARGAEESRRDYAYDRRGNVVATTLSVAGEAAPFTTATGFDPQRRAVRRTLPDGTVATNTYAYTRLVAQDLGGARISRPLADHDASGRPATVRHGTGDAGFTTTRTRSATGALLAERVDGAAGRVLDLAYTRDVLGRPTAVDDALDPARSVAYRYHDQRLASVRVGTGTTTPYEYDPSGNLRGKDGVSYGYVAHFPRVGTRDGDVVYEATQDPCGRTAARTAGGTRLRFDYDGRGALRQVREADGPPVLTVLTDHRGRPLRRTTRDGTTEVLVDADFRIVREPGGTATVERYLLDEAGVAAVVRGLAEAEVGYLHRDPKGSTTLVLDQTGAVRTRTSYDPYGRWRQELGAAPPGHAYENRHWLADVGLYDFGGRYYDPVRGRFLTPDPGPGAADPYRADAWNRFAFELNDPVDHVDPSGFAADWIAALALGSLAFGIGAGIVLSGGLLSPVLAPVAVAVGYGALSAGLSAVSYGLGHRDVSGGKFWAGLGVNVAVSFAISALSAGLGAGVGVGIAAAVKGVGTLAAGTRFAGAVPALGALVRVGGSVGYGAATGVTNGALLTFTGNIVDQQILHRDRGLGAGVGESALWGGLVGGVVGGFSGALGTALADNEKKVAALIAAGRTAGSTEKAFARALTNVAYNALPVTASAGYGIVAMLEPRPWELFG